MEARELRAGTGLGYNPSDAPVAQLDRASDFESGGRGFESLRAHHLLTPSCSSRRQNRYRVDFALGYGSDSIDRMNDPKYWFKLGAALHLDVAQMEYNSPARP
jgi:hypothetical protein